MENIQEQEFRQMVKDTLQEMVSEFSKEVTEEVPEVTNEVILPEGFEKKKYTKKELHEFIISEAKKLI